MAANPKAVADYRKGKKAAANSIKGAILRETRGAVPVEVVQRVLEEELDRGNNLPRPLPRDCTPRTFPPASLASVRPIFSDPLVGGSNPNPSKGESRGHCA